MNGDTGGSASKRMIRRTKSDHKIRVKEGGAGGRLGVGGERGEGKGGGGDKVQSKDRLGIFRRSFHKKSKTPVFEECKDDFTKFSISLHSPTSVSDSRTRAQTMESRPQARSKSQSDSETSDISPSMPGLSLKRASIQALFAEAAALEVGREGTGEDGGQGEEPAQSPPEKQIVSSCMAACRP